MFIIPVKYTEKNFISPLVQSIRKYKNNDKIVVVDSDSQDKSYFKTLPSDIIVEDIANCHYVDGAVWHCFHKFTDEEYFYVMHDSMLVYANLNGFKSKEFKALMYFEGNQHDSPEQVDYIRKQLSSIGLVYNFNYLALFGIAFFCKREVLQKLKDLGVNNLLPTNKVEMQGSERIWGFCLRHLGYDISIDAVKGKFHAPDSPRLIQKIWAKRD